jgi:hypothetical protein
MDVPEFPVPEFPLPEFPPSSPAVLCPRPRVPLTNTLLFGGPNTTPTSPLFGQITISQINLPRQVELALTYRF